MEAIGVRSAEPSLSGSDPLECGRIEISDHIRSQIRVLPGLSWFVHNLQRTDVTVGRCCVDAGGHPLEPLQRALVVLRCEPSRITDALQCLVSDLLLETPRVTCRDTYVAGELLVGSLRAGA